MLRRSRGTSVEAWRDLSRVSSRGKKKREKKAPSERTDGALVDRPPPQVEAVLETLDPSQQAVLQQYFEMAYSGPVPLAGEVERYDKVIPNGGDRIMAYAEREQAHRHKQDDRNADRLDKVVDNDILLSRRGQQFGGWLFLGLMLFAGYLVYRGELIPALGTFASGIILQGSSWFIARTIPRLPNAARAEAQEKKSGESK